MKVFRFWDNEEAEWYNNKGRTLYLIESHGWASIRYKHNLWSSMLTKDQQKERYTCEVFELVPDDLKEELSLILDVFNSCIVTQMLPAVDSPCRDTILELLEKAGREPTATL